MDKIDRIRKIISESSAAQERAKERLRDASKIQKRAELRYKKLSPDLKDRKKLSKLRQSGVAQSIKNAKFSKANITKVSDEGKTGVTAVGQTVGNVAKAGAAVAKNVVKGAAKAAVAAGNIKSGMERRKLAGLERNRLKANIKQREAKKNLVTARAKDIKKIRNEKNKDIKREKLSNMIKNNQPKRSLTAKSVREEFIQEVENKKDKVDKVIDIMRGKNKIQINPDVKESVDKKKI